MVAQILSFFVFFLLGISQLNGAPVELDLPSCGQATLPIGAKPVNCCPPPSSAPPVDYVYDISLPPRQRMAAHLVSEDYIAKYKKAYDLMRALPSSDPRSFTNQANIHCAYCSGAFKQVNGSLPIDIHNSWLFLPWHRWYLYFHERILGSLIKDDSFALPYWNWDNSSPVPPLANIMPTMYLGNSSLGDSLRNTDHLSPAIINLNYNGFDGINGSTLLGQNDVLMYQQMVSGAKTSRLFYGEPYRSGDLQGSGSGTIESAPHGPVHIWTGSALERNTEDMGALYSSARDPLFYAHHANIDRLWRVWKTLPGHRRHDPKHPDFMNATFLFFDEQSRLVRVRVADALSTEELGYTYQESPDAWRNSRPSTSGRPIKPPHAAVGNATGQPAISMFGPAVVGRSVKLEGVFRTKVQRPSNPIKPFDDDYNDGDVADGELEEVLVIQGVAFNCNKPTKVDVYVNLPEADENTPNDVIEYAGTFVNVAHGGMQDMTKEVEVRLGIGEILQRLGVQPGADIVVNLVPRGVGKQAPVSFKGFTVEYE